VLGTLVAAPLVNNGSFFRTAAVTFGAIDVRFYVLVVLARCFALGRHVVVFRFAADLNVALADVLDAPGRMATTQEGAVAVARVGVTRFVPVVIKSWKFLRVSKSNQNAGEEDERHNCGIHFCQ